MAPVDVRGDDGSYAGRSCTRLLKAIMWVLRTVEGVDPELTFRILPGNIRTIGRATGANFIVDAHLVSRVHCQLTAGAEALEVKDLDSTNGTFLNGERISGTARLKPGDRLGVGRVELLIERG